MIQTLWIATFFNHFGRIYSVEAGSPISILVSLKIWKCISAISMYSFSPSSTPEQSLLLANMFSNAWLDRYDLLMCFVAASGAEARDQTTCLLPALSCAAASVFIQRYLKPASKLLDTDLFCDCSSVALFVRRSVPISPKRTHAGMIIFFYQIIFQTVSRISDIMDECTVFQAKQQ